MIVRKDDDHMHCIPINVQMAVDCSFSSYSSCLDWTRSLGTMYGSARRTRIQPTRSGDGRAGVDGRMGDVSDEKVIFVGCEEFLPALERLVCQLDHLKLNDSAINTHFDLVGSEAPDIVSEMCLKAACDEGPGCISSSPGMLVLWLWSRRRWMS
jgi:hypothetical protein